MAYCKRWTGRTKKNKKLPFVKDGLGEQKKRTWPIVKHRQGEQNKYENGLF